MIETKKLECFAREHLQGELATDEKTRLKHSTDMSLYTIVPAAVFRPESDDDVANLLRFCSENRIPVTPRAGASNTGGAAIGDGVIVLPTDRRVAPRFFSRGETLVAEFDAGTRHDAVQRALRERGLFLPSDPSSGPLSYIGANVATRASGAHALRHGAIDRYLESLVAVLADGTRIDTAVPDSIPSRIIAGLDSIASSIRDDADSLSRIEAKRSMKSASGYNLGALLPRGRPNITQLFAGSVGTLCVIETVRLRCPWLEAGETLVVMSFDDERSACAAIERILRTGPAACEILNSYCVSVFAELGERYASRGEAMLVVEYAGTDHESSAARLAADIRSVPGVRSVVSVAEPDEKDEFWKTRKGMLLRLRSRSDGRAALSVVNDVGVPVETLPRFLDGLARIFGGRGIPLPVYGHAGDGNLHVRPLFSLADPSLADTVRAVADETYTLVLALGGTITAEHGMGRLRAPFLRREWGDAVHARMRDLKRLFDPAEVLNTDAMFYEGDVTEYFVPRS